MSSAFIGRRPDTAHAAMLIRTPITKLIGQRPGLGPLGLTYLTITGKNQDQDYLSLTSPYDKDSDYNHWTELDILFHVCDVATGSENTRYVIAQGWSPQIRHKVIRIKLTRTWDNSTPIQYVRQTDRQPRLVDAWKLTYYVTASATGEVMCYDVCLSMMNYAHNFQTGQRAVVNCKVRV